MTLSSCATWMAVALGLSVFGLAGHAHAQPAPRFKAVAFDYFVIFDANSIVPEVEKAFPGKSAEFTRVWRSKQFEYCYRAMHLTQVRQLVDFWRAAGLAEFAWQGEG